MSSATQEILGIKITAEPFAHVLSAIRESLEQPGRNGAYVCATSVHGVVEAQTDHELKNMLNNAFLNLPDGMPLVKVGRLLGSKQMERMWGPELFYRVCEMTSKMDVSHFFYGGQEGVAKELARNIQQKFPRFKVAGYYCPPFRPLSQQETLQITKRINESGADIVWVGLSTPKQEKWIGEFHTRLDVKLLFSVGAAFDYHTGRLKLTPPLFRRLGLEWFYRLLLEPRRLWRRYVKIVPYFLAKSGMQVARSVFLTKREMETKTREPT
ncbi:MAG: WecB/TagA/CpsF family glycosyltransferase [Pyrinomonadaceae bacterium]